MRRASLHRRRAQLAIEGLEDRLLLYSTLGAGWTYGSRITYSIAPDGTDIGGIPSDLYQGLATRGITPTQIQEAIQKAAAEWEASTNINLVMVSDNGSPYGIAGNQQGDSRFGDIRIGGSAWGYTNVLASGFLPPPINGGTLAGDIVFNSSQWWQVNGSTYDLQTVAMHEFGHALGLDHSSVSAAELYSTYTTGKQTLNADDKAGIQSIYGTRPADMFDAVASNSSYLNSSDLTPYIDGNAQVRLGLDISSTSDMDFYIVTVPQNTNGTMTVTVQATGLSSFSPKLTLFGSSLQTLASAEAPTSYGGTVTATITGVTAGEKYYYRVMRASGGAGTGVGAYALLTNFGSSPMAPMAPPVTTVQSAPDAGGGGRNEEIGDDFRQVGSLEAYADNLEIGTPSRTGFDPGGSRPSLAPGAVGAWAAFAPPMSETPEGGLKDRRAARLRAFDTAIGAWGRG